MEEEGENKQPLVLWLFRRHNTNGIYALLLFAKEINSNCRQNPDQGHGYSAR